jgi:hypothetical protein
MRELPIGAVITCALLGLAGCSKPTVHILVTRPGEGGGPESHASVKPGTVLKWTSATGAFRIQFQDGKNPCVPSTGAPSNAYDSTQAAPFTAQCTVTSKPVGSGPFHYDIISDKAAAVTPGNPRSPEGPGGAIPSVAAPGAPSVPVVVTHCEGCVVDIE